MEFAVAKECGRPIDELKRVPIYRRRQAEVIVVARHKARGQLLQNAAAKKLPISPRDIQFFGE